MIKRAQGLTGRVNIAPGISRNLQAVNFEDASALRVNFGAAPGVAVVWCLVLLSMA
eukprot:COSAG02_NODE_605_length_19635_cov_7.106982_13_plen_56_part_00